MPVFHHLKTFSGQSGPPKTGQQADLNGWQKLEGRKGSVNGRMWGVPRDGLPERLTGKLNLVRYAARLLEEAG